MIDSTKRQDTEIPLSQRAVDTAFQLLHQEQYETLVQLLTDFQLHAGEDGVSAAGYELLTMIRSLALACHLFNRSAIWHQQVGEEAFNQQEETAVVLKEFMQMLRDGNWEMLAHQAEFTLPYRQNGHGHDNLWQRIKRLFQGNGVDGIDTIKPPVFSTVTAHISDHEQPLAAQNGTHTQPTAQPTKQPLAATDTVQHDTEHTLLVYGLGVFCVYHQGKAISDWATRKSKSVFKYLLLNREKPVPKEILMEVFWPDSDETAARNNLNVTIYNLRQVFNKLDDAVSYILYQDDCYFLNPDLSIWFDYDVFRQHYQKGSKFLKQSQFADVVREFQAAELVYQGELFEEDRYDDWLLPQREAVYNHYVQMLEYLVKYAFEREQYMDCIPLCQKLLRVDKCLEETHRLLIQSYMKQGQNHLAVRQYYTCVQTLEDELGVLPSQDTTALYEKICIKMAKP